MGKQGVLIERTDVPPEIETDWNRWYNATYIPGRLSTGPGFLTARRFVTIERDLKYMSVVRHKPRYLTVYDLADIDAVRSEAYLELLQREASQPPDSFAARVEKLPNFSRGLYEQLYPDHGAYQPPGTKTIFAIGHNVPPDREEEFNAWYNTEHIPAMMRVPGFITARRCVAAQAHSTPAAVDPLSPKYIALYDLESDSAIDSDIYLRERDSPWSAWVRTWFKRRLAYVGTRIYPAP